MAILGGPDTRSGALWRDYPLAGTGESGQIRLTRATVQRGRELLVALPPGYGERETRYPVIYMQDGQNLFDPATAFAGDWGLVATLRKAAEEGHAAIVVGIPNRGWWRRHEYSPFRDLLHGGGGGDRYLALLTGTIKPMVDQAFRTRPEREHTVIAGSSLGGLISLYALYQHAGIFAAASVQSPALWFARRAIFRYLEGRPAPPGSRIHLDCGTAEGSDTLENVRAMRALLESAGYSAGATLSYAEAAGDGHDEAAWGRRFAEALPFLLGTPSPGDACSTSATAG